MWITLLVEVLPQAMDDAMSIVRQDLQRRWNIPDHRRVMPDDVCDAMEMRDQGCWAARPHGDKAG